MKAISFSQTDKKADASFLPLTKLVEEAELKFFDSLEGTKWDNPEKELIREAKFGEEKNPTPLISLLAKPNGVPLESVMEWAASRQATPVVDPSFIRPLSCKGWNISGLPVYFVAAGPYGSVTLVHCFPGLIGCDDSLWLKITGGLAVSHILALPDELARFAEQMVETDRFEDIEECEILASDRFRIDREPINLALASAQFVVDETSGVPKELEDSDEKTLSPAGKLARWTLVSKIPYIDITHVERSTANFFSTHLQRQFTFSPVSKVGSFITVATNAMIRGTDRVAITQAGGGRTKLGILLSGEATVNKLIIHAENSAISAEDVADKITAEGDSGVISTTRIDASSISDSEEYTASHVIQSILLQAVQLGASDIDISGQAENLTVRIRKDGKYILVTDKIPINLCRSIISRICIEANLDTQRSPVSQNGRWDSIISGNHYDIRANITPTVGGGDVSLRMLPRNQKIPDFKILGMRDHEQTLLTKAIDAYDGMTIFTGPTGSGKSTSIYAMLGKIDRVSYKVISGEDPVELVVPHVEQTELKGALNHEHFVVEALRRDPDYIVLSEVRSPATAKQMVTATITGHSTISTLHCSRASEAPLRLLDLGVANFLLASALKVVVSQRLIRKLCVHCAKKIDIPSAENLEKTGISFNGNPPPFLRRANGCKACGMTGYAGRIGIYESYLVNEAIQAEIMSGSPDPRVIEKEMISQGGMPLLDAATALLAQGLTTIEEVIAATSL